MKNRPDVRQDKSEADVAERLGKRALVLDADMRVLLEMLCV